MAQWICNPCGTPFTVGAEKCPQPGCRARDAHEDGGDTTVNVYDQLPAIELPAIEDDPVAQRLGLVPGKTATSDQAQDPTPVGEPASTNPGPTAGRRTSRNVSS